MKRCLFALCALLCLTFAAAPAVADEYVPLQPFHTGVWSDPARDGEGFSIYVSPDPVRAIAVLSYLDAQIGEDVPTWFLSNATPTRPATYLPILRVAGGERINMPGIGVVESRGCDALTLQLVIGLSSRVFELQRVTPAPAGLDCYVCADGDLSTACGY